MAETQIHSHVVNCVLSDVGSGTQATTSSSKQQHVGMNTIMQLKRKLLKLWLVPLLLGEAKLQLKFLIVRQY